MMEFKIKENSLLARVGAWKLGAPRMAMTIGSTIHLYKTTKTEFLADKSWVRHELAHVKQFRTHGFWTFIIKYSVESLRKGYYNNKYEVEAREAERPLHPDLR